MAGLDPRARVAEGRDRSMRTAEDRAFMEALRKLRPLVEVWDGENHYPVPATFWDKIPVPDRALVFAAPIPSESLRVLLWKELGKQPPTPEWMALVVKASAVDQVCAETKDAELERLDLDQAAREIAKRRGISEKDAWVELLGAMASGKLPAFGIESTSGRQVQIPRDYWKRR